MGLVDFILNLAALLLWINWRSSRFNPLARPTAATLLGTLKKAGPTRMELWRTPLYLGMLLGLRSVLYWQMGRVVGWTASLRVGAIAVPFDSKYFSLMLLYSVLSFGLTLAVFHFWLILLSLVNGRGTDADPLQRIVRSHLGWIDRMPWPVKLVVPLAVAGSLWMAMSPLLAYLQIIPGHRSPAHVFQQGLVIGLGSYVAWKYLVAGILLLHLVNSYVFFNNHPIWNYVNQTAQRMLLPLRLLPLRLSKVDLAPVVGIALVFLLAETAMNGLFTVEGLTGLYGRLPL